MKNLKHIVPTHEQEQFIDNILQFTRKNQWSISNVREGMAAVIEQMEEEATMQPSLFENVTAEGSEDTLSKPITKYECLNCDHNETQYTSEYKDVVVCPECHYGALVDSYKRSLYLSQPEQSFGKGNEAILSIK